jgi:prepilin-type N-terminal cleavage/methylation domain-containing protein
MGRRRYRPHAQQLLAARADTRAGFTLIEVLVAMVIFSISSLALAQLMWTSTQRVSSNNKLSYAVTLAQAQVEHLRQLTFEELSSGTDPDPRYLHNTPFSRDWTVELDPHNGDLKTVTISVSWDDRGAPQTYETQTIYTSVTE